ncbi:nuclear transport factor 2 family protein [Arthrobacter sp. YN]|uniref:nuclear transport factor 2 family protein n=1 Tax=Arthrobacter sp. YN TaxID=2020486 RepID=UPI0012FD70D9|nr:nuclear transport factor 2 family protein [Arthrobacter sp. YN]
MGTPDQYLQSEAVASKFFTAMNTMDPDIVGEIITEDARYKMPYAPQGLPQLIVGKSDFLGFVSMIKQGAEQVHPASPVLHDIQLNAINRDASVVYAEWKSTMRLLPSGVVYSNTYVGGSRSLTVQSANLLSGKIR